MVQASDLNGIGGDNFVSLPLIDETELEEDADYLVVIKHYGGAENVVVGTSGVSVPQTSLILDVPSNTWFYVTSTPMVRMNLDPSVSVKEEARQIFADPMAFPNPADDLTSLRFELIMEAEVQVAMTDAFGRTIQTKDLGSLPPGVHQFDLELDGVASGLYTVTLYSEFDDHTVRLMVR